MFRMEYILIWRVSESTKLASMADFDQVKPSWTTIFLIG
jgi:hypothetical protein